MGNLKRNDLIEAIQAKLSDPANLDEDIYNFLIDEIISRYSQTRPLEKVEDTTGDGTFTYGLPSDWIEGFSTIISIEYPFDSTNQIPTPLRSSVYRLYRDTSALKLRFLGVTPTSSETFRFRYTTQHTVTTTTSTIANVDEQAVVNLGAARLCEILAAEFEKKSKSTLPEGQFDLRTKSQEYHTQADRYYTLWREDIGIPQDGSVKAASGEIDTDWSLSGGKSPITHPLRVQ